MVVTVVICGEELTVELGNMAFYQELLNTTRVGSAWVERTSAEERRIELHGRTASGDEISGEYRLLRRDEKGRFHLEPWEWKNTVGGPTP